VTAVHQFVPMLHRADAVGRHTLRLRDVLVARGIESRLYVETTDPETAAETLPFSTYADRAAPGDVLVYQFATASDIAGWLLGRPETLVVNYHNVTPPEHYAPWDNGLARHQLRARTELAALAQRTTLGIAMSSYNEAELRAVGFAMTSVVPPAAMLPTPSAPVAKPAGTGARWISVGRLAPNKALQRAVMALLVTRGHHDSQAGLDIVGRSVVPAYTGALRRYVDELGLHDAVHFRGPLSDDALADAMAQAEVLITTSDHEGFGVPVVEAMSRGLPVVANDAGALREVLGDGGVLLDATDPFTTARAIAGIAGDPGARAAMAEGAAAQLAALDLATAGDRAVDQIVRVA
jgi:glycosyltransferase involved in cell wall biosynthesis